jgi:hypothetical protein
MLRNLISLALVVLSPSAWAQDSKAILGKTFEFTAEVKITNGEGTAATASIEQLTRKVRINRDGKVFLTVTSGAGGERGAVAKLNQSVNLVESGGTMPDAANFSYSSYVVWVAFRNGLWRFSENVRGISKTDHSECSNHTSTIVVFSLDLATCTPIAEGGTQRCGPPSDLLYHRELVRSVSCVVTSN